jgi:hypothetical protein
MRVGGTHEWYYDRGVWKEKKIAPDRWEFTYSVKKTRTWQEGGISAAHSSLFPEPH